MDETGKPLRAVAVFCAAIKYLRNHLVDALASTMKGVEPNWILENFTFQWVFCHPASWDEQTRQIIVMAAKQVRHLTERDRFNLKYSKHKNITIQQ